MESLRAFLDMGGYAVFVWPAFGITAVVMIGLLVISLIQLRQRRRQLEELEATVSRKRKSAA